MKFIPTLLVAVSLLCMISPAHADPTVSLDIELVGDRIEATYGLPEPVRDLTFPVGALGAADIQVEGADIALDGAHLSAPRPFSQVVLSIGPDRRELDAVYPLASRLEGHGYVIYLPHLLPEGMTTQVHLRGQSAPLDASAVEGYVLIGGTPEVFGDLRMAVSNGAPETFKAEAAQRAQALVAFYASRMESRLTRPPLVLLSYSAATSDTDPGRFRGDVSSNGVVFLRVRASAQGGSGLMKRYTSFLAHEIFHLWNASRNPDRREWWLHEGAAEYASWTATAALWAADAPSLEDRLTTALRTCSVTLGDRALSALSEPEARSVRYPCGVVLNWMADLGARAEPGGDIFTLWRALAAERDQTGRYTAETFLTTLDRSAPAAAASVRSIVEGQGIERWAQLAQTANGLEADTIVGPPAPFPLRLTASRALVLAACDEVHGVGDGQDGLFVQAPQGCSAFGEMTFIVSADGIDPAADADGFYQAVRAKCANHGDVEVVVRNDGEVTTRSVRCDVAVDPAPVDLVIRRALPVPALTLD